MSNNARADEVDDRQDEIIPSDDGVDYSEYADGDANSSSASFNADSLAKPKAVSFFDNRQDSNHNEKYSRRKLKKIIRESNKKDAQKNNTSHSDNNAIKRKIRSYKIKKVLVGIKTHIWDGKRKFITLFILMVVIVVPIVTIHFINKKAEEQFEYESAESAKASFEIVSEITNLMLESSDNYEKCVSIYEDAINNAKYKSEKVFLMSYYAGFVINTISDYDKAASLLDGINLEGVSRDAQAVYYSTLMKLYSVENANDEEKYNYYCELYKKVFYE